MRALYALAFAVLLAGCDSGAGEPGRDGLIGTWNLVSHTETEYGTVTLTQTALDFVHPGTGQIDITGDATATLRQLYSRSDNRDIEYVALQGVGSRQRAPARVLMAAFSRGPMTVEVYDDSGLLLETYTGPATSTLSDDGLRVLNTRLVGQRTGGTVTVNGSLTFARTTYVAGVEAPLYVHSIAPRSVLPHHVLSFSEGGALESGFYYQGATRRLFQGTWSRIGADSLGFVIVGDPVRDTGEYSYRYAIDAGTLSLTSAEECNSACAEAGARTSASLLGLEAGTVVGYRIHTATTYSGSESSRP